MTGTRPPGRPSSQRDAVAEMLSEGLSFREIAGILGCTTGNIALHFRVIWRLLGWQAV